MVLRYQQLQRHVSLTLPRYVSIKKGLNFVEEKREWIAQQLLHHEQSTPLADGQVIPVMGKHYTIRHIGGRGVVRVESDTILVPGDSAFIKRRIIDWLKKRVRDKIHHLATRYAKAIGKSIQKISLRDTTSRWGSCSYGGNLSFSWRLVFAPLEVLEYVVIHEVAHLKHHDHSDAFWNVVAALCPDYKRQQHWLKKHGPTLHAFG